MPRLSQSETTERLLQGAQTARQRRWIWRRMRKHTITTKVCVQCGDSYTSGSETSKYCSVACRSVAYRLRHPERFPAVSKPRKRKREPLSILSKECPACGISFCTTRKTKRYCSHGCQEGAWRRRHPARYRRKQAQYCASDHGRRVYQAAHQRRKARLRNANIGLTAEQWNDILNAHNHTCAYCMEPFTTQNPATMDHVIPISKGGLHVPHNVVPACRHCNSRKHDSLKWKPRALLAAQQNLFAEKAMPIVASAETGTRRQQ